MLPLCSDDQNSHNLVWNNYYIFSCMVIWTAVHSLESAWYFVSQEVSRWRFKLLFSIDQTVFPISTEGALARYTQIYVWSCVTKSFSSSWQPWLRLMLGFDWGRTGFKTRSLTLMVNTEVLQTAEKLLKKPGGLVNCLETFCIGCTCNSVRM